jgi:uncharacterized protein with HEPN domain
MFDKGLVREILERISEALAKIDDRTSTISNASFFTDSPAGMEKLDSLCMLFIAIGESLKNIDKITGGDLFPRYPEVDWTGAKKFRDIIAHHYFDVDAEQVFWICKNELAPLSRAIKKMLNDLC